MILVDIIAWIFFTCLVCFTLYGFIIIFKSSQGRFIDVEKREYQPQFHKKFTVVIYSHNNSAKVKTLVESFSRQNYTNDKYSINVILDNCDNENAKLLEILGNTRLWRLNTDVKPIGKYKSFAWFVERVRSVENTNAFIFLDAECKIKNDLLEKANKNLNENAVIAGETVKRKNFLLNRLINFRNKAQNRVIRHGRFYSGLGNVIDTDILLIRQDILEKISFETVDNGFEEYEYPLKLRYFNVPIAYSSDITVYKNRAETIKSIAMKDYKKRSRAFRTFLSNFNILFSRGKLSVKEYILSLLYPSETVFVFWNLALLYISLVYTDTYFSKIIGTNVVLWLVASRAFSVFCSLMTLRGNIRDYYNGGILIFLAPIIYARSMLIGFIAPIKEKKKKDKFVPNVINFETNVVEATITDGKKEFPCRIEITKTDENARVTFMFKNKKLNSSKQPRVSYAIEEIIDKLRRHGFSLKVCSNCGYFHITESSAAHSDGEQGYCLFRNFKENTTEKDFSPVWESCKDILPFQARGYILQQLGLKKNDSKNK